MANPTWVPGTPEYKAYQKEWIKRKRESDPVYRKMGSRKAREWQLRYPVRHALNLYKQSARYRNLELDLMDERLVHLLKQDCAYCGAAANPLNGIDRVDSNRGYVEGNVTTSCRRCNIAKNDMSLEEFKAWIKRVANHMER
jgi:hypothetical protein